MIRLFIIISLIIIGCSSNISDSELNWNQYELSDSLTIAFPDDYTLGNGQWWGRDTRIFYKARDDGKVSFSFETGPGTPYRSATVSALKDTHYVYPYGSHDSLIVDKYFNLQLIKTYTNLKLAFYSRPYVEYRHNGIVLYETNSQNYTEFLFVEFPESDQKEVKRILKTVGYR